MRTGFSAEKDGCFKELFSEAEFPSIDKDKAETLSGSFATPETTVTASNAGTTKGCSSMKKEDVVGGKWNFLSETAISNDKIGIFVLFEFSSDANQEWSARYQAYFFEKNNQKWGIKFGLISEVGSDFSGIKSPDERVKVNYDGSRKTATLEGDSQYSGNWTASEKGSQQLLLDSVFKYLKEAKSSSYVYKDDKKLYKKGEEGAGFVTIYNAKIKKWFEPFENKKGEWKKLS